MPGGEWPEDGGFSPERFFNVKDVHVGAAVRKIHPKRLGFPSNSSTFMVLLRSNQENASSVGSGRGDRGGFMGWRQQGNPQRTLFSV